MCESVLADDNRTLSSFCDFYDRFAAQKGLEMLDRSGLVRYASSGVLDLSQAKDPDGEVVVWHAHLLTQKRVRLLYSASLFRETEDNQRRNLIGRANRYLHWGDMLRFRTTGLSLYDFGGWYPGDTDDALLRINKFFAILISRFPSSEKRKH